MQLLVDKYRPHKIEEVYGHKEAREILSNILSIGNFPHLLFTGPPGNGKTSCAKIIAKYIIEPDRYKDSVLELNASDDRGIDVVRDKIKSFSQKKLNTNSIVKKIIILDEADSMTTAAQQALRRIMETSADTRFILICNTFTKIFEPIQSRCAVMKFDKLEDADIKMCIEKILIEEKIVYDNESLDMIVNLADGDMRQALNICQSTSFLGIEEGLDPDTIVKITGKPSPKVIVKIVDLLINKKIDEAVDLFNTLWAEKYDATDIIQGFFKCGKSKDSYEILKAVGPTHLRIIEGHTSKLHFYAMFNEIVKNYQ